MSRRVLAAAVLGPALLAWAACGTEPAGRPAGGAGGSDDAPATPLARPTTVPAAPGEVTTTWPVTVLDDGDGAELCLGGVAQSLPPQCGGPGLLGWDWTDHVGDFEDVSGTRWGDFLVVGTFDGTDVSPTEVVPADEVEVPDPVEDGDPFETPCPEPDGGWVVDPSLATERDVDHAFRVARRLDDYAGSFVDLSLDPRSPEEMDQGVPARIPVPTIVNVSVTSDPEAAEAAIREVWGGGLCLSEARHTQAELARVQRQVGDLPGMTSSSGGDDVVDLGVVYDDGSIQAWVDQEHGAGVVRVTGGLVDT